MCVHEWTTAAFDSKLSFFPALARAQSSPALGLSWLMQQTAAQSFIVLKPRPFSSLHWSFCSLGRKKKSCHLSVRLLPHLISFSLFSTEIWVIMPSCLSKRTPSLRWGTCRSCKCDHFKDRFGSRFSVDARQNTRWISLWSAGKVSTKQCFSVNNRLTVSLLSSHWRRASS